MIRMKWKSAVLSAALLTGLLAAAWSVNAADPAPAALTTDAETAASLGLLIGDGGGVNAAYLAKPSTRLQAAIISLRLQGMLDEAMAYTGTDTFRDASQVGTANRPVLAYLKSRPELGWQGQGDGAFEPAAPISSQQLYKVLLEALGYKQDADFAYADAEAFAAGKGLAQIAGTKTLHNADIAAALTEALRAGRAEGSGGGTLLAALQSAGAIAADVRLPAASVTIRHDAKLGAYLADDSGMTLYLFTKDMEDRESCQAQCLANWPVFAADSLQIPSSLNKADFGVYTRADGTKQLTYRSSPLYYFIKDTAAGQVNGQAVNNVWYVIDPAAPAGGSPGDVQPQAATYTVDIQDFSFGSGPLTVEAGSKVTFTNHDDMKHNAVAVDGSFRTPLLAKGESYTITLDQAGTFDYYCEPHKAFMTGTLIVK